MLAAQGTTTTPCGTSLAVTRANHSKAIARFWGGTGRYKVTWSTNLGPKTDNCPPIFCQGTLAGSDSLGLKPLSSTEGKVHLAEQCSSLPLFTNHQSDPQCHPQLTRGLARGTSQCREMKWQNNWGAKCISNELFRVLRKAHQVENFQLAIPPAERKDRLCPTLTPSSGQRVRGSLHKNESPCFAGLLRRAIEGRKGNWTSQVYKAMCTILNQHIDQGWASIFVLSQERTRGWKKKKYGIYILDDS